MKYPELPMADGELLDSRAERAWTKESMNYYAAQCVRAALEEIVVAIEALETEAWQQYKNDPSSYREGRGDAFGASVAAIRSMINE